MLAQKLLAQHRLGPIEALWYTTPFTLGWLGVLVLCTRPRPSSRGSLRLVALHPALFAGAAFAGAFVQLTSFVKRTSSMTVKVLTMVRGAGLILFSALVLGEQTTPLECPRVFRRLHAREGAALSSPRVDAVAWLLLHARLWSDTHATKNREHVFRERQPYNYHIFACLSTINETKRRDADRCRLCAAPPTPHRPGHGSYSR